MFLSSFLEQSKHDTFFQKNVICFVGREYPLLFFSYLFLFFKKYGRSIKRINCVEAGNSAIKTELSMFSFLSTAVYWLEDFYLLSDKKQQELITFLASYNGPHYVIFFSDKKTSIESSVVLSFLVITLPEKIGFTDFASIRLLIDENLHDKTDFASRLIMYGDHLSLDILCLLTHYELIIGTVSDDFFDQWIMRIIDPSNSLFILSQYFFGKKSKQFFRQWSILSERYLGTFWPTFWADQCWRAYIYCDLMQQKKYAEAKKAQYKLPFSFINKDWLLYTLDELRNAHQFLYTIDFKLKNGGSEIALEYFYTQFFENNFK